MILQNESDRAELYVTKSPGFAAKVLEAQGRKQAVSTNGDFFFFLTEWPTSEFSSSAWTRAHGS